MFAGSVRALHECMHACMHECAVVVWYKIASSI